MSDEPSGLPAQTVIGLFDDQIDAEHALSALRKSARSASSVSVLARDRVAGKQSGESPIDVTRAVMDTALTTMSSWLTGLAALMVPDHGVFLAAGPIGMVLANVDPDEQRVENVSEELPEPIGSVGHALERFGFPKEESYYLEQRLAAGSALIAVTANDPDQIEATLRTFADFDAVFIGQAETADEVVAETRRWQANPLATESSQVIIADVVVSLRSANKDREHLVRAAEWCGLEVQSETGDRIGEIEDVLVDPSDDELLRYVVVAHGGLFGIAKRRAAIPATRVRIVEEGVRLSGDVPLGDAPVFDPATPFSRKDELASLEYFGLRPYWIED